MNFRRLLVGSAERFSRQFTQPKEAAGVIAAADGVKAAAGGAKTVAAAATVAVTLAACGSSPELGTVGHVEGFLGGVAADEPLAAQIGRDVLSAGGSAADAVVAMYFASAVTLPSAASLGGGGVCLGFDPEAGRGEGEVRALEFLARRPGRTTSRVDRPMAVPGNIRGFYAFHARFGRLRWAQLITPAEHLARFGFPVSRALATDIEPVERALAAEPDAVRVFSARDGSGVVSEGDFLTQVELAAVLARIRTEGAGAFYTGPLARQFVEAVREAGGDLDLDDLRDYQPLWRDPIRVRMGDEWAHFAPSPAVGGAIAARMWSSLVASNRFRNAGPQQRSALLAELGAETAAERRRLLRQAGAGSDDSGIENPSAATFVAADRDGGAAACAVTLNSLFGTGRVAQGTGIVTAAAPGPGGRGATALGPMLIVNENVGEFYFAAAAAGGVAAPTALVTVAANAVLADRTLSTAMTERRVLGGAAPGVVYHETGAGGAAAGGQAARGVAVSSLGRVNAIWCPQGIPPNPETCETRTDPRGYGLSTMADPGS